MEGARRPLAPLGMQLGKRALGLAATLPAFGYCDIYQQSSSSVGRENAEANVASMELDRTRSSRPARISLTHEDARKWL